MIQKLAWLALFVSLSSVLLYGAPQMTGEKAPATQTVTGCLQKGTEPVGFFLISTDNKHWELYSNKDVALADHVGHTVTVTGTRRQKPASRTKRNGRKATRRFAGIEREDGQYDLQIRVDASLWH